MIDAKDLILMRARASAAVENPAIDCNGTWTSVAEDIPFLCNEVERLQVYERVLRPFTLADGTTIPIDTKEARCRYIAWHFIPLIQQGLLGANQESDGRWRGFGGTSISTHLMETHATEAQAICAAIVAAGLIAKEEIE